MVAAEAGMMLSLPPPSSPGRRGGQRAYFSEMLSLGLAEAEVVSRSEYATDDVKLERPPMASSYSRDPALSCAPTNLSATLFDNHAIEPKVITAYKPKPGGMPRKLEIERKKRLYAAQDVETLLLARAIDYGQPHVSSLGRALGVGARAADDDDDDGGGDEDEDEDEAFNRRARAAAEVAEALADVAHALPLVAFDNTEYEVHSPREWLAMGAESGGLPARALRVADDARDLGAARRRSF